MQHFCGSRCENQCLACGVTIRWPFDLSCGPPDGSARAGARGPARRSIWREPVRRRSRTGWEPVGPRLAGPRPAGSRSAGWRPAGSRSARSRLGGSRPDSSRPDSSRPDGSRPKASHKPAQGNALGKFANAISPEGAGPSARVLCRPFGAGPFFRVFPGRCPGLACDRPSAFDFPRFHTSSPVSSQRGSEAKRGDLRPI